jgi:hypothetical protein
MNDCRYRIAACPQACPFPCQRYAELALRPDSGLGQGPAVLYPMEISKAGARYAVECRLADLDVVRREAARHLRWGDDDMRVPLIIRQAAEEHKDAPIYWAYEIGLRRGASTIRRRIRLAVDDLIAMISPDTKEET